MLGRSLLLPVAMATLCRANCAVEPPTENDPFDSDEEHGLHILPISSENDPRALRVPDAPIHVPTPVRISGPPRNEDHTYTMNRPSRTKIPGWSPRPHQPATSTEESSETALTMTQESVSIPTVLVTSPTPPLVWWTLPKPDQESTVPLNTASATLSEPTTSLEPATTLEPTTTPAPKEKSRTFTGPIITTIIGGLIFLGILILISWLLFRRYKRKRANAPRPRPTIVHPFRGDLSRAPGRESVSYFIPDTPSERRWGWSNAWGDAFRAWTRVPQRNRQGHDMDVISRPATTYTNRPISNPSPLAGNPFWTAGDIRPLANTYTTRPANSPYLSPNTYTARPVSNGPPSPYTESIYSQEGRGVRPDSGRPLGGNWL